MDLHLEKKQLKKELDKVEDKHLIRAIRELLKYAQTKEEEILKPFTKTQLLKRAQQSEDDIKNGRTTTIEQLRKEMQKW